MDVCTKQKKEIEVPHEALVISDALVVLCCVKASCIISYYIHELIH